MTKKRHIDFSLFKRVTLDTLDMIVDGIFLTDLTEKVSFNYLNSKWEHNIHDYEKAKLCETIVSKIAKNNGWKAKKKTVMESYLIEDEILRHPKVLTFLYRRKNDVNN
tara:strand:+ start:26 stop:349 length:324 start_codon:yes stop_codon:yes gene_type:complete